MKLDVEDFLLLSLLLPSLPRMLTCQAMSWQMSSRRLRLVLVALFAYLSEHRVLGTKGELSLFSSERVFRY